jgi:hypothetical protein
LAAVTPIIKGLLELGDFGLMLDHFAFKLVARRRVAQYGSAEEQGHPQSGVHTHGRR